MNYPYQYFKLICNRIEHPLTEGCLERHHIIPKSEGGSDDTDNIVRLTLREHFVVHKLLYKIYNDGKMAQAFVFMSNRFKTKTSKMYENAKIAARQLQSKAGKKTCAKLTFEQRSKAGKKGGKASIAKMTREQRSARARKMLENQTFEQRSAISKKGGKASAAKMTPEQLSARGKKGGKAHKGSKWWNNGIECSYYKECPGDGWIRGRLKKQKDRQDK